MGLTFRTEFCISDQFRDLFKRHRYEIYILDILNKSNKIFYDKQFAKTLCEANGECDFTDQGGVKYDVKLLIDSSQGELLGQRKNELVLWIDEMPKESSEFSSCIEQRDLKSISNTKLYRIMRTQMSKFALNENAILFCPFPVVNDVEGSIFLQLATDFLQATYDKIKEENFVGDRETYFIYPSMERNIFVLRSADSRAREYIEAHGLGKYFNFYTTIDSK